MRDVNQALQFMNGSEGSERTSSSHLNIPFKAPRASFVAQLVKNPPAMWETSILAWRIPGGCKESDMTE